MTILDTLAYAWVALRAHRVRTRLTFGAIGVGVGSVLTLMALGAGARDWIVARFASLGSNILVAMPGRTETRGQAPMSVMSTRDITLADMDAVQRRTPGVRRVVPVVVGEATVSHERRGRAATIVGTSRAFLEIRDVRTEAGTNLPEIGSASDTPVCIIGRTVRRDLYAGANPLGSRLRIGDSAFRVIGVIAQKGQSMMVNLDDVVLVPVASAMKLFNQEGLFRLLVQFPAGTNLEAAQKGLESVLRERHDGEEDFTVLTPGSIAAALGDIIGIITAALAAIAAVSLAVAGVGVMNVMIVSVAERSAEIGLMKAVGASRAQVLSIFLAEAVALALSGGAVGIGGGVGLAAVGRAAFPDFPFYVPAWTILAAGGTAAFTGVLFGMLPALRAARLDPLEALRRKA